VTDANTCTKTQAVTITAPTALVVTPATQVNVSCNGGSNGAASVSVSGGTTSYSYNWTPGNPPGDGTASVTGLTAGSWTCTVTDANSCTTTQTFNITAPSAISVTTNTQTNVTCNGGSNGAASINTPTGGAGGFTYNWTPGNPPGDGTISVTGLTAGSWTCTVTDANACNATRTFSITQPSVISTSVSAQTNVSCFGGSNGQATISASGGTSGYTYSWAPSGGTAATASGLAAGSYTCTVTDANTCTKTQAVTITAPTALVVTPASQANVNCNGGSNGAASVSVSGGTTSYSYNWTPGNPPGDGTASVTGLTAGSWTCTVTDANACSATRTFSITQPSVISTSVSAQTNVSCFGGSNGQATISASGGTSGYTYSWAPSGGTAATASGLAAGSYTCTVTDANTCTKTQAVTITAPTALVVTPASQANVSCNGGSNGAASVSVSGGTTSYSYNWTPGNPPGDGTASVTGLTAGSWTCTVTDANACNATRTFSITQPSVISTSVSAQTNVSCFGGSNGQATISASGGTSGYTYSWAPSGGTAATASGLAAGSYTCTVTDANTCTKAQAVTITAPTALVVTPASQANVSCNGGSNGAASVSVSGGTTSYSYNWTPGNPPGDGTASVTGLTAGSWTCTVTDANSCSTTQTFSITAPTALVVTPVAQTNVSCFGGSNGAASVSVSGGTTAYSFNWTPGNPTGDGSASVTGLTAGTWTCTVTDANACSATQTFSITSPTAISVVTATHVNISCNGGSNGSASINTPTGGTPGYTYDWTPGAPTGDGTTAVSGLTAGSYTCTVTDANTCTATQTFNITEPSTISSSISAQTNVTCSGGSNGSATVSASGGTPGYTYLWMPGGATTATATGLAAGSYTCTITDANTCTKTQTVTITQPSGISASISGTNVTCNGYANGTASVSASGGTGTLTYTWAPSGGSASSASALAPGSYTCTVTDASSCSLQKTIALTQPAVLTITTISSNSAVCSGDLLSLSSALSGGSATYTYSWSGPNGFTSTLQNPSISGVSTAAGGSYTLTASDANSCTSTGTNTISVTVNSLPTPTFSVAPNPTLAGLNAAFVSPTPAITLFSWNFGDASAATGSSTAHVYGSGGTFTPTLSVTDVNGCNGSVTTTVTVNTSVAAISSSPVFCIGDDPITLTHEITGGTWTSSNTVSATVGLTTGVVTAVAPGYATITYHIGAGYTQTVLAMVAPLPIPISGLASTCEGATSGLFNTSGGSGSWSSSNSAIASIGTASGVVSGISPGTATITYTNAYGCYTTREHSINGAPAAISGTTTLCAAATTNLSCSPTGGSWTSSNTGVATIDASTGVATGVAGGTATISYLLSTGCGSSTSLYTTAQPAAIAGSLVLCPGGNTTLSSATTGGTWSTADGAIATINATSGLVNAISAGTATMTYTASTGCTRTTVVTVNAAPAASTGNQLMCVGGSFTLSNATGGGAWSSSSSTIATINSATGVITGTGVGNANITYSVTGSACFSFLQVTVNAIPAAIVGSPTICLAETATLTHPVSGGTWTSSHTYRATIDAATGEVNAISVGMTTITYNTTTTCFRTFGLVIKALPSTISGTTTLCEGSTASLTSGPSGGAWTTGSSAVATINASTGVLTAVGAGTTNVTYTNGCLITAPISVNTTPSAITGTTATCGGETTTLSCATSGGSWSSSMTGIATVGSGTGIVSGITTGTTRISYLLPSGCYSSVVVTVGSMPAAITGTLTLCDGGNVTTLSSATTGGTWSSSAAGVATTGAAVSSSTMVTGISTGTANISYTVNGCSQTAAVTVNAGPAAISGSTSLCVGSSAVFTSSTTGGTWSSSSPAYANIGSTTGIANATAIGTTTISYLSGATCYTTTDVTVNSAPAAITGSSFVCIGLSTTLSHSTTGGIWSSSATGTATVDAATGVVTGVAAGVATITYTIGAGCYKTTTITVYGPPASIAGTGIACVGTATTLTNSTTGGTWTSANTAIATVVLTTGVVTGVSDGTATITYQSSSTGCYSTKTVTINALPSSISGGPSVCVGATASLSSSPSGGTWSSSSPSIAQIGTTTGIVTGITGGGSTITYTVPTGCRTTLNVTVINPPASISGTLTLCTGNTTTLTSSTASQTWSSSNTSVATVGSASSTTGLVTGAGAGTATISYTNASGCYRTATVTIDAPIAANTGDNLVCVGQTVSLSNATSGGTWASSATAKATVGYYTGVITGVATGTANITYIVPSGCIAITQLTVNAAPAAISGATSVCVGQTITLSHTSTGGTWSTTSTTATVDGSGVVTGLSAGYAYITYSLSSGCTKTITILVRALPLSIAGSSSATIGAYTILTNATSGGIWSTDNAAIASMPFTSLGYVLGVSAGSTTITYRIPSTGCFVTHSISVASPRPGIATNINGIASAFSVFPNPTSGALSITAEVDGNFTMFTLEGKLVQQYQVTSGNNSVSLPNDLAAGIYICHFNGKDGSTNMVRLVVEK
jgi:large repetitive protein